MNAPAPSQDAQLAHPRISKHRPQRRAPTLRAEHVLHGIGHAGCVIVHDELEPLSADQLDRLLLIHGSPALASAGISALNIACWHNEQWTCTLMRPDNKVCFLAGAATLPGSVKAKER